MLAESKPAYGQTVLLWREGGIYVKANRQSRGLYLERTIPGVFHVGFCD